jgi:hypothetical protein
MKQYAYTTCEDHAVAGEMKQHTTCEDHAVAGDKVA